LQFDPRSAQGKLIASLTAALAEFGRDLLRERVRSGIAAARKRGVVFGRRPGQRVKADRFASKVLKLVGEGQSYREISHRLGLSENTVLGIASATARPDSRAMPQPPEWFTLHHRHPSPLLIIVAIVAVPKVWVAVRGKLPPRPELELAGNALKARYAAEYLGLVCFLTLMAKPTSQPPELRIDSNMRLRSATARRSYQLERNRTFGPEQVIVSLRITGYGRTRFRTRHKSFRSAFPIFHI
jgi:Resolvase, N terminal domain